MGVINAMVPRRIPIVDIKEFTLPDGNKTYERKLRKFKLGHLAVMLNTFPMKLKANRLKIDPNSQLDYNKYLPIDRLEPFRYEKFRINTLNYSKETYPRIASECLSA